MKLKKSNKRIFEPPAILLTDLAFNLVIFFVVCASMEPASGRKQPVPSSNKDQTATQSAQNVEVYLKLDSVAVNGTIVPRHDLADRLRPLVAGKTKMEERMVVLKCDKNVFYRDWIEVTAAIEEAGGVVALQLEETAEKPAP